MQLRSFFVSQKIAARHMQARPDQTVPSLTKTNCPNYPPSLIIRLRREERIFLVG